jgi:hypothetical protein
VRYSPTAPNSPIAYPASNTATGSIAEFDIKTGKCVSLQTDSARLGSALSQDGQYAAVTSSTVTTGTATATVPANPVVTWRIDVLRTSDWTGIKSINTYQQAVPSAVDCTGQNVAATGPGAIFFRNGEPVGETPFPVLSLLALSCTGSLVATIGTPVTSYSNPSNINIWSLENRSSPIAELLGPSSGAGALSATRMQFVLADYAGGLQVWQLDRKPPASDLLWPALMQHFDDTTRACLTPEQREKLIGENYSEAKTKYDACRKRESLP